MEKLRVLALHGFRTSGEILKSQVSKWPESVLKKLEIHYLDGPFPAGGKSDVEAYYPPPYYEWFQFDSQSGKYGNVEECVAFIEDYMFLHGPFHGLLGFSQGAFLTAVLAGVQEKGLGLASVPPISFVIIVSGAKFRPTHNLHTVYSPEIRCPSVHFLGEKDFLKPYGEDLMTSFVDPAVIRHPAPHTVPRLDAEATETMVGFLDRVKQSLLSNGNWTIADNQVCRKSKVEAPLQNGEESTLGVSEATMRFGASHYSDPLGTSISSM